MGCVVKAVNEGKSALCCFLPALEATDRVGYSRASTTLDTYSHFLNHRDAEVSNKLDSIISETREKVI